MGAKPWYAAAARGPLPSLSRKLVAAPVGQEESGRFGLAPPTPHASGAVCR